MNHVKTSRVGGPPPVAGKNAPYEAHSCAKDCQTSKAFLHPALARSTQAESLYIWQLHRSARAPRCDQESIPPIDHLYKGDGFPGWPHLQKAQIKNDKEKHTNTKKKTGHKHLFFLYEEIAHLYFLSLFGDFQYN